MAFVYTDSVLGLQKTNGTPLTALKLKAIQARQGANTYGPGAGQFLTPIISIHITEFAVAVLTFLGHLRQVDFHIIEPPRGAGRCRRLPEASGQPTRPPPRHHAQTNADRTRYLDGLLVSGAGARVETVRFERLAHPSRHRDMGRCRCSPKWFFGRGLLGSPRTQRR